MIEKPITEKTNLHPRNLHRFGYDFNLLTANCPELLPFVINNEFDDNQTIDFSNPEGVLWLNKALLITYYQIIDWIFYNNLYL